MNGNLQDKARIAASWPYTVRVSKDETIDGQIVFLAMHPELPGCMAQGEDVKEATENLKEVTFEYILSLLEDRVPIPMPSGRTKTTTSYSISNTTTGNKSFLDILSEAVQPCTREEVSTVELVR